MGRVLGSTRRGAASGFLMVARSNRQPSRRNDPAGLRRKVLDAAFGMFQTQGYNGTSMQDLTKAIEVTGGALHHHFPTKRSIALAVFAERVAPAVRAKDSRACSISWSGS